MMLMLSLIPNKSLSPIIATLPVIYLYSSDVINFKPFKHSVFYSRDILIKLSFL